MKAAVKKKIVVIDDESDMLVLVHVILSAQGYEVVTGQSPSVLENLENLHVDMVLLDINLGNGNGGEICKSLKTNDNTKMIPVILMSGTRNIQEISSCCGADGFLPKPFPSRELINIVTNNI